jgi:hypothetical protein
VLTGCRLEVAGKTASGLSTALQEAWLLLLMAVLACVRRCCVLGLCMQLGGVRWTCRICWPLCWTS